MPNRFVALIAPALICLLALPGASATLTPIRVAITNHLIFRTPLYVASRQGFFRAEGLDVELDNMQVGSDAMKLLASGGVEFDSGPPIDGIHAIEQGVGISGVALMNSTFQNSVIVTKSQAGTIKKFADLKGHTMGVTGIGSATWQFAMLLTAKSGLKPEEIQFVSLGTNAQIAEVEAGRVDAMAATDPEPYELVRSGAASWLVDMLDPATHQRYVAKPVLFADIMANDDYIRSHPVQVQAFVNGMQRGMNWCNTHSPAELAAVLKTFPAFDPYALKDLTAMEQRLKPTLPKSVAITREEYTNAMTVVRTIGQLKTDIPFEQAIKASFGEHAAKAYPPPK
jgi:NitT/TauT family transport system substrate-binding protein